MIEESDPTLSFHPQDEPIEGATVFLNRWWIVHPDKGLVVCRGHSLQCNQQRAVVVMLQERLYPWAEVLFFDVAMVKVEKASWT